VGVPVQDWVAPFFVPLVMVVYHGKRMSRSKLLTSWSSEAERDWDRHPMSSAWYTWKTLNLPLSPTSWRCTAQLTYHSGNWSFNGWSFGGCYPRSNHGDILSICKCTVQWRSCNHHHHPPPELSLVPKLQFCTKGWCTMAHTCKFRYLGGMGKRITVGGWPGQKCETLSEK
jgi:hypothetical protein